MQMSCPFCHTPMKSIADDALACDACDIILEVKYYKADGTPCDPVRSVISDDDADPE